MVKSLQVEEYLEKSEASGLITAINHKLIDVRTPSEFNQGHIPGSKNIPLFNDSERVVIGTIYKQQGKQAAVAKGLELIGPRMNEIIQNCTSMTTENTLFIHCWRGGMRSCSVAWLLDLYGLNIFTLKGGYKAFRRFVFSAFAEKRTIKILGGRTGSSKTKVLHGLSEMGEQMIDLEKLADHKGSSFGALGEQEPSTQEQFENQLSIELKKSNPAKATWLEDESRLIGKKVIPQSLWNQMREAEVIYLDIPFAERAQYFTREYGKFSKTELSEAITRISRRLGSEQTKNALAALAEDNLQTVCEICLRYYDKSYDHNLNQRDPTTIKKYVFEKIDAEAMAEKITSPHYPFIYLYATLKGLRK